MGFMDKVLYNAKNVANAASEKAGEVYEVGKLKLRLASLNGDLDKAYGQLGRLTYEEKRTGADNALLIDACLTEIDGLLEDIQGLTAEISAATGEKICPHCAESVPADAAFCPKCGARWMPSRPLPRRTAPMTKPMLHCRRRASPARRSEDCFPKNETACRTPGGPFFDGMNRGVRP